MTCGTLRAVAATAALAATLGGCAGGPPTPSPASTATAPQPGSTAPVDLPGRWALTALGATCAVNLGPPAGPGEGAVRPEGGCGGNFYTTRKWTFENGALILRDHNGKALAQLRLLGHGRFEGQTAAGGEPVSLVR